MMSDYDQMKLAKLIAAERERNVKKLREAKAIIVRKNRGKTAPVVAVRSTQRVSC